MSGPGGVLRALPEEGSALMTNQKINRADMVCVVFPEFVVWTGETTMSDKELQSIGAQIDGKVVKSGTKRIFKQEKLNVFEALRQRAYRILNAVGRPYMKGVAVPLAKADELFVELDAIVAEFYREKQDFLADYDATVRQWIEENPQSRDLIIAGMKSATQVAGRLSAQYRVCRVVPVTDAQAEQIEKDLDQMGDDLLRELSKKAEKLMTSVIFAREEINRRSCGELFSIRDKLASLSFLTSSALPIVQMLDDVVAGLPKTGTVTGRALSEVRTAVLLLANEALLNRFIDGDIDFADAQKALLPEAKPVRSEVGTSMFGTEPVQIEPARKPVLVNDVDLAPKAKPVLPRFSAEEKAKLQAEETERFMNSLFGDEEEKHEAENDAEKTPEKTDSGIDALRERAEAEAKSAAQAAAGLAEPIPDMNTVSDFDLGIGFESAGSCFSL